MSKKLALAKPAAPSTLALPPTAPPPRKEDIINAMIERARVKHAEESAKLNAKREAALNELHQALLDELKDNPGHFTLTFHGLYHSPEIEYILKMIPPHIRSLRDKVKMVPSVGLFDAAAVRRKIRDQYSNVSAGERVKALLSNAEAVKALDAALEKIG